MLNVTFITFTICLLIRSSSNRKFAAKAERRLYIIIFQYKLRLNTTNTDALGFKIVYLLGYKGQINRYQCNPDHSNAGVCNNGIRTGGINTRRYTGNTRRAIVEQSQSNFQ